MRLIVAGALALAGLATPLHAAQARLTIFAAASLSDPFRELARLFERRHPGSSVRLNFAGSQQLAAQLDQGARADLFASADARWIDFLRARGRVAGEPRVFASNRLVVIVPRRNPAGIETLADLARPGVKLVLAADAVPLGRYSREALARLAAMPGAGADYARRALRNVVSHEEQAKAVVAKVQLGEADAGIVYRSDLTPAVRTAVRALEIPERYNVPASYVAVRLVEAGDAAGVEGFLRLLTGAEGREILARHGFLPPAGRAHDREAR
ncbi:MAG TPA: molybdate ABC transporter substrate-binding protein [Gemmatimonadales bacterium]|nr:molybdate ABC transporter substrate-binding protein [Gemmatimonadales bacterium]